MIFFYLNLCTFLGNGLFAAYDLMRGGSPLHSVILMASSCAVCALLVQDVSPPPRPAEAPR